MRFNNPIKCPEAKDVIVQNEESKIKGKTESPFDFLKRVKLEFADFYCVSERDELSEFEELMQAKSSADGVSLKEQEKRGRGKLILLLELGIQTPGKHGEKKNSRLNKWK
ncbi:hypothetical protein L914_18272 [Phytophthora nicotianae]|uniref:Uncharacterized protein n=1 Tax=Phytophthora nicotianae TaxID=4792 RepID=W2MED1_PHYNI|nr:hypothetical protein L914_18272 [Phytophthora nicotianae]